MTSDPQGVDYDERTALVVVDVQNDFADANGSLYVQGGEEVVAAANREIARARSAGALVVYTQDWHPETTPHFAKDGGVWPTHCVQDTWGAALHPGLRVEGPVILKGVDGQDGYSGFSVRDPQSGEQQPTALEQILRDHGIERVVVVGLAQDVCVKETALDARRLGFDTVVVRDATAAVNLQPDDEQRAYEAMKDAGAAIR
ncbi:MAG TPA: isochorismatase family protein [Egibacteraceae bacterium]|jgi:nicotinamidase/pyrazinamidase|nr:isochorismatase family protein [Egibacteraceae bacterium]